MSLKYLFTKCDALYTNTKLKKITNLNESRYRAYTYYNLQGLIFKTC